MSSLNNVAADYSAANHTVTVTGNAGANDRVRVLLNPVLPTGATDDYIFTNYGSIPALDKKEKANAGTFSLVLDAGTTPPDYTVKVVSSSGKGVELLVHGTVTPIGGGVGGTTTPPS